jgi:hypothetical protein
VNGSYTIDRRLDDALLDIRSSSAPIIARFSSLARASKHTRRSIIKRKTGGSIILFGVPFQVTYQPTSSLRDDSSSRAVLRRVIDLSCGEIVNETPGAFLQSSAAVPAALCCRPVDNIK